MSDAKYSASVIATTFLLLLTLETVFPLRKRKSLRSRRIAINLCFTASVFLVGAYTVKPVALYLAHWTSEFRFGLLSIGKVPFVAQFIIGFMLMDLTFYYWHRVNHIFPLFWRFHNVHHIDPDLDVSTSFRFHFVEVLYSTGFRALQVSLIGVAPLTYVVYEIVFQCATMFHHSNLRLPIRAERWLNKILVTPRMHGIHHSFIKGETNSNYSVIFRWWDMLHRSLRLNIPQSAITIGVAGYQSREDNKLWSLLIVPFRRQKEYWSLADGTRPVREQFVKGAEPQILLE